MDKKQKVLNTVLFQTVSRRPEFRGKITVNSSGIFLNDKLVCSLDSFLKLQRREEFINLLRQPEIKEMNMKRNTELKLRKIIERIIREETEQKITQTIELSSSRGMRDETRTMSLSDWKEWIDDELNRYKSDLQSVMRNRDENMRDSNYKNSAIAHKQKQDITNKKKSISNLLKLKKRLKI